MADLTQKALNIADHGADLADAFLDAVEGLEKLLKIATDSSLNMATYDAAFGEVSTLKHIDGVTFNRLATAIPNIVTAIDAANSAGTGITIRKLFNQLRKSY